MPTRIPLLLLLTSLLFGCTATKKLEGDLAAMTRRNQTLAADNRRLADDLTRQQRTSARLQLEVVEKQIEIDKAGAVRDKVKRKVDSPRARVITAGSRAEAVTCLAEVEIEADAAGRGSLTGGEKQKFAQVEDLLGEGRDALDRDRYDQVCTLASQALALIDAVQTQSAPIRQAKASAYADFLQPLRLVTTKRSNIRSRPSIYGSILETLAAGSTLTAHGSRGKWVKVTTAAGNTGWISYPLLALPVTGNPPPRS